MEDFTKNVVQVISDIPEGRVMTYGQIAAEAGSRRAARQVVRVLHSMSKKYSLPWHRVLNAQGEIAVRDDASFQMQVLLLESEGVHIVDGRFVRLETYQFHPSDIK